MNRRSFVLCAASVSLMPSFARAADSVTGRFAAQRKETKLGRGLTSTQPLISLLWTRRTTPPHIPGIALPQANGLQCAKALTGALTGGGILLDPQ